MLREEHSPLSGIPHRPRNVPAPPGNPGICMHGVISAASRDRRDVGPYVIGQIAARRVNSICQADYTCWHTYVCTNAHAGYCFSLIESFVNVPSFVVVARKDDVGVIVRNAMISGDKYVTSYFAR